MKKRKFRIFLYFLSFILFYLLSIFDLNSLSIHLFALSISLMLFEVLTKKYNKISLIAREVIFILNVIYLKPLLIIINFTFLFIIPLIAKGEKDNYLNQRNRELFYFIFIALITLILKKHEIFLNQEIIYNSILITFFFLTKKTYVILTTKNNKTYFYAIEIINFINTLIFSTGLGFLISKGYYLYSEFLILFIISANIISIEVNNRYLENNMITKDDLTKVGNKQILKSKIKKYIENQIKFSFIMIDLDDFKEINDTYGHVVGDKALKFFADNLRKTIREEDIFRYGGDEFSLLLKTTNQSEKIISRIINVIENNPFEIENKEVYIRASFGYFEYQGDTSIHLEKIINNADKKMYEDKKNKMRF